MIIVQVAGGLGNQMQQYALYRKYVSLGREARLDLSWFADPAEVYCRRAFELSFFPELTYEQCTGEERAKYIAGDSIIGKLKTKHAKKKGLLYDESVMYDPAILDKNDGYLRGYWACEKYYRDILPELRESFRFGKAKNALAQAKNLETMNEMDAHYDRSVSVHIRRGDYLDPENRALLGGICTPQYYEGAAAYVKRHALSVSTEPMHFYIFSDDPDYARLLHFGGEEDKNTVISWNTGEDSLYDMQLMSHCKYEICANSTFSFWGARLNPHEDKMMLRPATHKNTQSASPEVMHDYWAGWILLDTAGKLV